MKVCWLTSGAAPYTLRLFEEIGKTIDLYVVMDDVKEANRNSEWQIKNSGNYSLYTIDNNYSKMINSLAEECDVLINGIYLSTYGYKAAKAFKKRHKKVAMIADGGIAKDRGFILNGLMSYLMKLHDSFLSSSKITDEYYNFYGINSDLIHHYRFTSLSNDDLKNNKKLATKKQELRKKLGIDDKYTIISVGQPIRRKGFDILVESYSKSGLKDKINLFIVGGKPQTEIEKMVVDNKLENVHFIDLLTTDKLNEYYAASDLFVLSTREDIWGLVIEEAMSFGLPIITSDMCVAGRHFQLLSENVCICKSEDTEEFKDAIINFYNKRDDASNIKHNILDTIDSYSIENSSSDIINILNLL